MSVALALTLVACQASVEPSPPRPTTTPEACVEPALIELDEGWRFSTDPDDVGISRGWSEPSFADGDWRHLSPGRPWEEHGLDYDGVAWYRTTLTLPAWSRVYLGFGEIDDTATLWVNGKQQMSWEAGDRHSEAQALDITGLADPGAGVALALRISDRGGYGGVKGAIRLSDEPRGVMGGPEYVRYLFESHPDWPMPGWLRGGPLAYTMTGRPESGVEALVRSDGAVAPWATGPTAELWLYDPSTGSLATGPADSTIFSLHEGHLPMPAWQWEAMGAGVTSVLYSDAGDDAVRWQASLRNGTEEPLELIVLLVVRPLGINRSLAPICSIGLEGKSRVWMDGSPYLFAGTEPSEAGVSSLQGVMAAALRGTAPDGERTSSHRSGLGAGTMVYPLELSPGESETFSFAFPVARHAAGDREPFPSMDHDGLSETTAEWEKAVDQVGISVPDELIEGGVKASTAYLLLALDLKGPHPGPLAHDSMWVRDAAYVGLALLQMGHADKVRSYIPDLLAAQEEDGRVPPIQGDDIPWDDEEWDAQGQMIFLVTSYYRYTGELPALEAWYPALRSAADFIIELRATKADPGGPTAGLLPPSKSAEDLGPEDRHYYWDDFWAVVGLQEAAYAGRVLGEPEDADRFEAEADDLRQAILDSVEHLMGEEPEYVPGAVEDLESSAMARGTVPALWPVRVLSPESALMQRSFDVYHERWVAPDAGGFRHRQGQFWPYGGLELAHAYLRLGRTDVLHEILGWTLTHQTLEGTYAWAEQVNPENGGISGGDMPHAWAAASYATLVREMIVTENEERLELFTGVPDWWFEGDRKITLTRAPTHFGALDLHTDGNVQQTDDGWTGVLRLTLSGAKPPGGFHWRMPYEPASIDGPPGLIVEDGWLTVPGSGGTVRLSFSTATP